MFRIPRYFLLGLPLRAPIPALALAVSLVAGQTAIAEQCPREGLSEACCARADPLDGLDREEGGYSWHPGPFETAGLCQGLASRNVSGRSIEILDLREGDLPSPLSDRLFITRRDLPWTSSGPFAFSGASLVPGNTYFIAGTFAVGLSVVWETTPFVAAGQRLGDFGFFAVTRHQRRVFYTPIRFAESDGSHGPRSEAQLVLRSTEAITDAAVTAIPLNYELVADMAQRQTLDHKPRGARSLNVTLPPNLPEVFLVSIALCTAADDATCTVSADSPATITFRIAWPGSL